MHFLGSFFWSTKELLQHVDAWISAGGYYVLFGLLAACGLGLPLPEDIPLITAGAFVARGQMNLAVAAIVAWCGIIGGDCILYSISRRYGMGVTKLPLIGKHVTETRIRRVQVLFEKYGVGVIFIGRMFAGIRGAMVVACGVIRYNFLTFIIADGLGAVVSGGFFLFVGHFLGKNLNEENITKFKHWFVGGGILIAVIFIGYMIWRRKHHTPSEEVAKVIVEKTAGQAAE